MAHDYTFKFIGKSTQDTFDAQISGVPRRSVRPLKGGMGTGALPTSPTPGACRFHRCSPGRPTPRDGAGAEEMFCSELAFLAELARKRKLVFIFDGGESDLHANMHFNSRDRRLHPASSWPRA